MPIIIVDHVSKIFPARRGARALFGRGGLGSLLRTERREGCLALDDVSLNVEAGESLGIIGRNGSGKSTLLKILAGVTLPSRGEVQVTGRVASLLELGAGFHPMLTGRENIFLNGQILGLSRSEIAAIFDEVVRFSGVGAFIDQPVDTYSSGMYVRIAFSVAVHADPDIFLVDEVLSVGDEEFQRQCRRRIGELREAGKTILFVSHDLGLVHALCDRVVLLESGKMLSRGNAEETITYYLRRIGRAGGIHSMRHGDLEMLFVHGKISIYRSGVEITAPQGIQAIVQSLGTFHASSQADWEVIERSETHCRAKGRLPRVPLIFEFQMRLDAVQAHMVVEVELERPFKLDYYGVQIQLPAHYDTWITRSKQTRLPAHLPGDVAWTHVFFGDSQSDTGVAWASQADTMPPVRFRGPAEGEKGVWNVHNTDYMAGARVVALECYRPGSAQLEPGRMRLLSFSMDLSEDRTAVLETIAKARDEATLCWNGFSVYFEDGALQCTMDGQPITAHLHAHTQRRMGGMWQLSNQLRWDLPERKGARLRLVGHAHRAPLCEIWELEELGDGIRWRVWLESKAEIELGEMNVSIALDSCFSTWRTEEEAGVFPASLPEQREWLHCNARYEGRTIVAEADGRATVTLTALGGRPCGMSALITPPEIGVRVLQAILSPERAGVFRLAPGLHLMFDGVLQANRS